MLTIEVEPTTFDPWLDSDMASAVWVAVHNQALAYQAMPHGVESTDVTRKAERDVEASIGRLIQAVIETEREACAALADEFKSLPHGSVPALGLEATWQAADQIGTAIRNRT